MSKERVVVSFKLDRDVKEEMSALCDALGLSMTTAFTVFAKRMVRDSGFPFELAADPFYSRSNQARLRRSIEQMESEGATSAPHPKTSDSDL